ncbi:hypothetical protein NCC49_005163 [Naganishia albida]|nr:hypothetical protein NCC49_005163 [Naganishia albida]
MPLIRTSSGIVIRCFKSVEAFADWLTGAAGFWFVCLCWALTATGGFAFFDVLFIHQPLTLARALFLPAATLIAYNLYGNYYLVTTVDPGHPLTAWRARDPDVVRVVEDARRGGGGRGIKACGKCRGPKPVRTHHCSVCKRCVLMMDHHCPWINQCVGLHNLRYFLLFMAWLSLACWAVTAVGYDTLWLSLDHRPAWHAWTPPLVFTLIYILSAAIGLAVPVLLAWHVLLVARGETSIEAHDNDYFTKRAREQGLRYVNPYDLGWKKNLELCFNLGPAGRLSYWTLLVPKRYEPASAGGWRYPLNPAAGEGEGEGEAEGVVVGDEGDELTDDEGGGAGYWVDE